MPSLALTAHRRDLWFSEPCVYAGNKGTEGPVPALTGRTEGPYGFKVDSGPAPSIVMMWSRRSFFAPAADDEMPGPPRVSPRPQPSLLSFI